MGSLSSYFKLGAGTGGTIGGFETVKADLSMGRWDSGIDMSEEIAFVGRARLYGPEGRDRFAMNGDCGSWVFDESGNWLGMVFAASKVGSSRRTSQVLSYVTPARDVVDDIEAFCKESGCDVLVEMP